jgi:hypothetical protein
MFSGMLEKNEFWVWSYEGFQAGTDLMERP